MDALFLSAILREAGPVLEGARVLRADPDGPEGVVITLQGPDGRVHLSMGWGAWGPHWYLGRESPRGEGEGPFAATLAAHLRGGRVTGLVRPGMERAVGLQVAWRRGRTARCLVLWAFLWPAGRNVVLVDVDAGLVITAARPGPWRPGGVFEAPPPAGDLLLETDARERFEARLGAAAADGAPLESSVTRAFPGLGPILAREVAFRAGGPAALWDAFTAVAAVARGEGVAPRVVLGEEGDLQALAPLALEHVPAERQRAFLSANAAAEAFHAARRAAAETAAARTAMGRVLRQARARLARRLDALQVELEAHRQAGALRERGEILVAHLRAVPRGAAEVALPDPYGGPGATRTIALDPAVSAAANAERYFKRARRGARGEAVTAQRLAASRRELDRIADLEKALADATSPDALRDLDAAVRRLGRVPGPESRVPSPGSVVAQRVGPRPPLRGGAAKRRGAEAQVARVARRFVSTDGLAILVGRSNAANDELTLHVARPDDLWLHVEGYGGSHVVVRRGDRSEVPRQTLVEAAQLAAYYSQARGQRKVPVHYTLRKHVRKPKGAKAGLVTITQEKTLFATPDPGLVRRLAVAAEAATG